jgi:hypothetical protein
MQHLVQAQSELFYERPEMKIQRDCPFKLCRLSPAVPLTLFVGAGGRRRESADRMLLAL